jgi:manganese/zinc/iron transport system substrate-binding protein
MQEMKWGKRVMGAANRMMIKVMMACLLAVGLAACSAATSGGAMNGKVKITTTIGMIADVARQIGGEYVEVTGLMKAGVDPHLYKATQGDLRKLLDADIVFYNGLHLEGKMGEMLEKLSKDKPTVAVTKNIPETRLMDDGTGAGYDPHIWFDVSLWMIAAETIRDELITLDPAHEQAYRTNADDYLAKMKELDTYAREQLASIPKESRVLVTAHDAFGYFGAAYDIEVMGLQGMSTASEAGIKDVSDLRDFLVKRNIKAVFVESSVPKKTIEAVVNGAKQQGHPVSIGGELFSDAMGKEGTEEGTYIGMVRHNVDTIVRALR